MTKNRFVISLVVIAPAILLIGFIFLYLPHRETSPELAYTDELGNICCITWSPDDKQLIVGGQRLFWYTPDSQAFSPFQQINSGPVTDIDVNSTDGVVAVTNFPDVDSWDADNGNHLNTFADHVQYRVFEHVALSADGSLLAAASSGGYPRSQLFVWETDTQEMIYNGINHDTFCEVDSWDECRISALSWSKDNVLAIAIAQSSTVYLFDGTGFHEIDFSPESVAIIALQWNLKNGLLTVGNSDGNIITYDPSHQTKAYLSTIHSSPVLGLSWNSKNQLASVSNGAVVIWDVESNRFHRIEADGATSLAWSHDGDRLAISFERGLQILDASAIQF